VGERRDGGRAVAGQILEGRVGPRVRRRGGVDPIPTAVDGVGLGGDDTDPRVRRRVVGWLGVRVAIQIDIF
jgi:hypothetical protein